ncbi:MAG TPA: hypothetical protein VK477_04955 [Acidobacteriota bacterium]|nr:hypothetical protein [Acidobacteriota bacterium]
MHIVTDLEPDRPATAARRAASPDPAPDDALLRWLHSQLLASAPASLDISHSPPAHENLAN